MAESFDKIKAEIIAHLKKLESKENSDELKKAIDYFTETESCVNRLEKSAGKWIEKAGYGVGTVRIWKGKKYKKISASPVRWVRVFDKMDRGAKNALTRLIHQAEKIDNPEEMMKFVLANKQRFVDDNGKPLDFIDRLNAVIDGKTYSDKSPKATVTDSQTNERVIADKKDPGDRTKEGNKEIIRGNDYTKEHKLEFKINMNGVILGKPKMDQELFDELSQYSMGSDSSKLAPKYGLRGEEFLALVNKVQDNRVDIIGNEAESKREDNAKPTITFDRNGRLGEKAVNTKLSTDNVKAFNTLTSKFADEKRYMLELPSEVEIDGEKKLAYTNGQFLVIANEISPDVKTNQTEKREGQYPNVSRVIPKEFTDGTAPKVDIDIDQVMKNLPKVDFSKKAFNDDSQKQYMKIGNFWYDAKMVKATYDMLKGDNAEVSESKDTYSNGRFGRLCIKTDKGYSVIVSSSNDYAENYSKQAIYDSDKGSMSANDKAAYENKKKTGLTDDQFNNAVSFGYTPDNKGFMHGSDKDISFKASGRDTEFYYKGVPTGYKNRSSLLFDKKDYIDEAVDNCKAMVEHRIDEYKEGQKEPANMPANYDKTFPKMTNENLTDIYKWWSDPKNTEKLIYQGQSGRKGIPGVGGNVTSRMLGKVESAVMKMLPDIKDEIQRRGITIKKSVDGELYFETSLESYVKKSISVLKKSLLA